MQTLILKAADQELIRLTVQLPADQSLHSMVISLMASSKHKPILDAIEQSNEGIGKWRYKDISGPNGKPDGVITPDDRTFMGSPHPNFTMGFNFNASYKNFDLTAFLYWKNGGEIVNYVRYWTDFNTFQGNRDKRVLYDSWTPSNTNAKLPVLDASDGASGQVPVSYYVEPGGYLSMRNLVIRLYSSYQYIETFIYG